MKTANKGKLSPWKTRALSTRANVEHTFHSDLKQEAREPGIYTPTLIHHWIKTFSGGYRFPHTSFLCVRKPPDKEINVLAAGGQAKGTEMIKPVGGDVARAKMASTAP